MSIKTDVNASTFVEWLFQPSSGVVVGGSTYPSVFPSLVFCLGAVGSQWINICWWRSDHERLRLYIYTHTQRWRSADECALWDSPG